MNLKANQRYFADKLIKKYHYSKRPPANVQLCITWHDNGGLFDDFGECLAAIYFSIPPTRWSEKVFELSRLVRKDCDIKLTILISQAMKYLKKNNLIDLVVSFADPTFNHHGGIYQASSWYYSGKREKRMDGLIINNKFIPGRTCNSIYGTQSPIKLLELHGIEAKPHYDEGKYLYWKPLNKSGIDEAIRLGLHKHPYPKPNNLI